MNNSIINGQFLVLQDIGTKSNTSIFITFIIMQLAVEQKLTIPNPFIHRSISSYSKTHFHSVTDRKKRKRKDMTDMPSTWFLLLNNRHERAFSFLEGMMNEFYHILIRKADIILPRNQSVVYPPISDRTKHVLRS